MGATIVIEAASFLPEKVIGLIHLMYSPFVIIKILNIQIIGQNADSEDKKG